ncbi:hypothetical protein ACOSQ2_016112 [Xanthoceras sorbifolium]
MGRSRGNLHSNNEDLTQRSRRSKKNVSRENAESSSAGQGTSEGKRALYHCNYCYKDITGKVRIKCAVCPDFDLCAECFSVGAEVHPHKSNHPYRVMDNLAFPLLCPDWNADEEILLLEGIDMYGFHWEEVVKHVGTKTKEQCIDHYTNVYLKSPVFPLPDMSHVAGKDRKDLLAEDKKGASMFAGLSLKEKTEEPHKGGQPSGVNADPQQQRSSKGKKKVSSKAEGPSLAERSGYNSKRHEFDQEYDNDAEQMLADIEFKDTDTADERELKLRMIRIYTKRVEERKRRKDFVIERNLLNPNPFEKDLSAEERALCRQYDAFMRFHSKKDHEELLRTVISEHRTLKRIQQLKEARAAGCRTSAEADRYLELKRRREAEEASRKAKESAQVRPSSSHDQQQQQGGSNVFMASGRPAAATRQQAAAAASSSSSSSHLNDFDIMRFHEVRLLSEAEKRLCAELRLPPPFYLKMQEVISRGVFSGKVTKKADAHRFFKIDPTIVDKVYDMLVKKGLAPTP